MRAHLLRGDIPAATRVAERLDAGQVTRPDPLDLLVEAALDLGRVQLARQILAGATPAPAQSAHLRARIAQSLGDFDSAKAILVMAIEQLPDAAALRTHLAEVMVAAGTAAEARAVLAHIGQPPVNPRDPANPADSGDTGATDHPETPRLPSSRIG